VASNSATNELLGIERKMLEALRTSFEAWKGQGVSIVPAPLIKLMEVTHSSIRERVKRQFGIDTRNMSLREQLIELRQMEQQILELLELEEEEKEGLDA